MKNKLANINILHLLDILLVFENYFDSTYITIFIYIDRSVIKFF